MLDLLHFKSLKQISIISIFCTLSNILVHNLFKSLKCLFCVSCEILIIEKYSSRQQE